MNQRRVAGLAAVGFVAWTASVLAQSSEPVEAAREFRKDGQPVSPVNDRTIIAEAEEFQVTKPGWQAKPYGANYYAATFANSFLSRQAYLGAPEQGKRTEAQIVVQVPKAGRYLALVRYEAAYRFETRFTLVVEQGGQVKLNRLYGARQNLKVWAFGKKLQTEVAWDWGAGENIVWEGHDAFVELEVGPAKLTLIAGPQPGDAAHRNVDLVMLTSDEDQVKERIAKENYLPLDGMLTQAGDVWLKVHNAKGSAALTLTVPPGTEHSPYWVHLRRWKPITIPAEPGQATGWVEVGSLLDTLSHGQWNLTAAGKGPLSFDLEFGVKDGQSAIQTIRKLEKLTGNVALAYFGDTRYRRQIRTQEEVLYDLVAYLKRQPVHGRPPQRTLIYGITFNRKPGQDRYNAAVDEFVRLTGATALVPNLTEAVTTDVGLVRGYLDVRGVPTPKLEAYCQKLKAAGQADQVAVVSLGDEIGLAKPPAQDDAGFRAWLKTRNIKPAEIDPAAGDDYDQLAYSPGPETAKTRPGLYYYSQLYAYRYGINQIKARTDILRKYLPQAGIGANFSPHHGPMYLGPTHQWISLFREDAMTMPWGEDYIFQVPMASQQVNSLMVDMFRAGLRHRPERKIHYYVMPHMPNNTPASWRRQWYGDIAHGVRVFNLFEFRPVQVAYTENHVDHPEMYQAVRRAIHELGLFEDIVQDGRPAPAQVGLWFSEAADVWNDNRSPFDAAKRCLYLAIRHQQQPLDVVVEGDDLKPYRVLYLSDQHVSRAAAKALAAWVDQGGFLFATAGAGMFDEFNQPNQVLRDLFGVQPKEMEEAREVIRFEKQDLPFAQRLDKVILDQAKKTMPVYGACSRLAAAGSEVLARFADGSAAWTVRRVGRGQAAYCGVLPGLSYMQPALPKGPWDRGARDDSLTHWIPTQLDPQAAALIRFPLRFEPPVVCSEPLVETNLIQSQHGTLIPLINWSAGPVKGLTVTLNHAVPAAKVSLASGMPVTVTKQQGKVVFTLDLAVADALILRE